MWTQLFWPHNVAASAMNRMADSSWRAFGARGSRTSRKIDNTGCIEGLPNQGTPQNQLSSRWQQPLFTNAIPLGVLPGRNPQGPALPDGVGLAREALAGGAPGGRGQVPEQGAGTLRPGAQPG